MYWREHYSSPQDALRKARGAARGSVRMNAAQRMAAVSALGELTETSELGSLKSFLKKAVKIGTKLSPSHQIAKAISPKLLALSPSHILAEKLSVTSKSAPKTPPAAAPASAVPEPVVIPVAPLDFSSQPLPFAQGGGGGGGFVPAPAAVAAEEGISMPVMIGLGVGALLYFVFTKKGRR